MMPTAVRTKSTLRVLLIGPFKGRDSSGEAFLAPPLGLYRIKFYVEHVIKGITVDILDPNLTDYRAIHNDYSVIGLSLLHLTLENDLRLFYYFRARFPRAVFIAGGVEASFLGKRIFEYAPFNIVVLGEGEKAFGGILSRILSGRRGFQGIKSIYWRDRDKIKFNGYGKQLEGDEFRRLYRDFKIKEIPYSRYWRHNAELYQQPRPVEIKTIRAVFSNFCPFRCRFCVSGNFISYSYSGKLSGKKRFCILPVNNVIGFIVKAVEAHKGVKTIIFDDDNLSLDLGYLKELCKRIIALKRQGRLKKNLTFICQGCPDVFAKKGKEVLGLMKAAGFRMIMYGVESLSDRVLASLGKRLTRQEALGAVGATRASGIVPLVYIILFPPAILREDLIETMDLCVNEFLKGAEISTTLLVMDIPGCEFYYDKTLRRYRRVYKIGKAATIKKSEYIWPNNEGLFRLAQQIYKGYPRYEEDFKRRFGVRHVPGRVYSLILFDAIYKKLGLRGRSRGFRKLLAQNIRRYR